MYNTTCSIVASQPAILSQSVLLEGKLPKLAWYLIPMPKKFAKCRYAPRGTRHYAAKCKRCWLQSSDLKCNSSNTNIRLCTGKLKRDCARGEKGRKEKKWKERKRKGHLTSSSSIDPPIIPRSRPDFEGWLLSQNIRKYDAAENDPKSIDHIFFAQTIKNYGSNMCL